MTIRDDAETARVPVAMPQAARRGRFSTGVSSHLAHRPMMEAASSIT
jgi:hypothetical protein